jgi:hypothetical protein
MTKLRLPQGKYRQTHRVWVTVRECVQPVSNDQSEVEYEVNGGAQRTLPKGSSRTTAPRAHRFSDSSSRIWHQGRVSLLLRSLRSRIGRPEQRNEDCRRKS